nr:MAG TPA: hypothetical protein [Caudoviricetes sp.]
MLESQQGPRKPPNSACGGRPYLLRFRSSAKVANDKEFGI